jgi:hypothetical protein
MSRVRPKWLRKSEVGKGKVKYNGKVYSYTITKPDMANTDDGRTLKLHVGYFNLEHLFISEAIPLEFRSYVLQHELRELIEFSGQKGRCKSSLTSELSEIPLTLLGKYLPFRLQFFQELIAYYASNPPDFMDELADSLTYIKEYIQFRNSMRDHRDEDDESVFSYR